MISARRMAAAVWNKRRGFMKADTYAGFLMTLQH